MNERDVWINKSDLQKQLRQLEAECVIDSSMPAIGHDQFLDAGVAVGRRNRKQSGQIDVETNYKAARSRDRSHFAQRIERTRKVAEKHSTVDHVEIIARQAGVVGGDIDETNITVTIGFGLAFGDGELLGTDIDRCDFAPGTHRAGK